MMGRRALTAIPTPAALIAVIGLIALIAVPASFGGLFPVARAGTYPTATTVKPAITGLVDKGQEAPYHEGRAWPTADPAEVGADAAAFGGIVVNEAWSQLQPHPGQTDLTPLARSLHAVTGYNIAHPGHPLTVKLRIWAGAAAPAWAKALAGGPVSVDTLQGQFTTGRWWTRPYRRAWSSFQHALAAAYDDDPLIGSVAVTSCATLTAEPFVFSPSRPLLQELVADGWSTAAQQRCLDGAFHDYAGWVTTPIDYTFNPMLRISSTGTIAGSDLSFSEATMRRCADLLRMTGRQCILSNHAFTSSVAGSRSAPIYTEIRSLFRADPAHVEIDLQTNSPGNFGGCEAIDLAVADHATSLEVWPPAPLGGYPGFAAYSSAQLANWGRALRTQRALHCP